MYGMYFVDEDRAQELMQSIAEEVYGGLSGEDKAYMREHPDPIEYHFGLGLYIRNKYIYRNAALSGIAQSGIGADDLSGRIIELVLEKVMKDAEQ